jgi:hypothetical protein
VRIERRGGAVFVVGRLSAPGAAATTVGRFVFVRRGYETSEYLIAHELVHVGQYRERGLLGFLVPYLSRYVVLRLDGWPHLAAYRRLPEEVEADWQARLALGWGGTGGGPASRGGSSASLTS